MVDAVLEAFQGAWQITILPAGTVVEIAMIWRRAPRYEDTMKEQHEDFMRRIAGLPLRVILAGMSVMRDPYDASGTPVVYISHYSGAVVAVKHGIFTKICTLAEECELPEGKYKVVYTR